MVFFAGIVHSSRHAFSDRTNVFFVRARPRNVAISNDERAEERDKG